MSSAFITLLLSVVFSCSFSFSHFYLVHPDFPSLYPWNYFLNVNALLNDSTFGWFKVKRKTFERTMWVNKHNESERLRCDIVERMKNLCGETEAIGERWRNSLLQRQVMSISYWCRFIVGIRVVSRAAPHQRQQTAEDWRPNTHACISVTNSKCTWHNIYLTIQIFVGFKQNE